MMAIIRKIGSFLEGHIEKIVLALAGLVCLWLLITRILISPNAVSYDNSRFGPSKIDKYIRQQAQRLEDKLNQPPAPGKEYVSRLNGVLDANDPVREGIPGELKEGFAGLMGMAIPSVDTSFPVPLPNNISTDIIGGRQYALPVTDGLIGEVNNVAIEHIRAATYVPTLQVTEDTPYENAVPQPDDIDLVTVEAKFNIADLYKKFKESFAGEDVPVQWRDPCLAIPVFAAVSMQRQELLDDGSWSDWQDVPRSKIDRRKRMFEIVEGVEALPPGGIKVRLLKFNEPDVIMELLQPPSYQIASAGQEWFPPSLHKKFVELRKKEKLQERRDEIQKQKEETGRQSDQQLFDDRRGGGIGTRPGQNRSSGGLSNEGAGTTQRRGTRDEGRGTRRGRDTGRAGRGDTGLYGDAGLGDTGPYGGQRRPRTRSPDERMNEINPLYPGQARDTRTGSRSAVSQPVSEDVYYEYENLLITEMTDLSKWREPLVFWAHDDTVDPGSTYRYRIRLGVFNPVAGTNQLKPQYKSLQNQAILWTTFSEETNPVAIQKRLYFFAKDIQEAAKKVTVQVSRYVLGYWYSEDFPVRQGEAIGKVVELEKKTSAYAGAGLTTRGLRGSMMGFPYQNTTERRDSRRPDLYMLQEISNEPDTIDYSTGAVLVDTVAVNDYIPQGGSPAAGPLRPRLYFDMFFTFDGTNIERMAISAVNWPSELTAVYNDINSLSKETREPLRAWGGRATGITRRRVAPEGYEQMDQYYQMMQEDMMGGID
ncbi:MAG: hypothetical protein MUP16_04825 [Sedimentisphaerales bacterium]|nr:hypothetical protein [Sedimentisphaerales bacterium]